jgi:phenylalanyl-tRNA synthetase alpha chain
MSSEADEYIKQGQAMFEAFKSEFERFERFRTTEGTSGLAFQDAELALRQLDELRTKYTSKKSTLAALKKKIGLVSVEERAGFNQGLGLITLGITDRVVEAETSLKSYIYAKRITLEQLDVTLPGRRPRRGHLHPVTIMWQKLEDVFVAMGYAVEDGPEIETDFYNFAALNIPDNHPAKSPLDTFYTTDGFALRSQTSTVQIRGMERRRPPLRIIAPGKVFRRDTPDATHNPMFYQIEGLLVDRGITLAHLRGTVAEFLRRLFGQQTRTRFRASYFPFTEPSAEFDFSCFKCGGTGCRLCKGSGWIELGGSGMVHPNVLRIVDIDPEEFSGFAFGFGIDRMCALMYELDDIRLLFENDTRFLEQFN